MNQTASAQKFDAFLSYNSFDWEAVSEVKRGLDAKRLNSFMDRAELQRGSRFRPEIEDALRVAGAGVVFCGRMGMGPWQHLEVDYMLVRNRREPTYPIISVILPGGNPPLGFLEVFLWIDLRELALPEGLELLAKAIGKEHEDARLREHSEQTRAGVSPYRALDPFREEDAPFFCGRKQAIEDLKEKLRVKHVVAVVGASGVGKSSLVQAGLLPELRKDAEAGWEIASLVPTSEPLKELAAAFVPFLEPNLSRLDRLVKVREYATALLEQKIHLVDLVEELLKAQPEIKRILLVVNQWEELYSLPKNSQAGDRFIAELLEASASGSFKVVLTLRGDFVGDALRNRPLSDRLQDAQINLSQMSQAELEEAIVKPAQKLGCDFEPGLVSRILTDAGGESPEAGTLPPLEFVLDRLWKSRRGNTLTHAVYEELGGIKEALARIAEEVYRDLDDKGKESMRQLFVQMGALTTDGKFGRRPATIPAELRSLVKLLADKRLLVTSWSGEKGEEIVEIAHEALIWHWPKLKGWLTDANLFLRWHDRLRNAMDQYEKADRKRGALLHEPLIKEAEFYRDSRVGKLDEQELGFIARSRANRDLRIRSTIYGSLAATGIATLLLIVAGKQWKRAEELRGRAEAANQLALSRQLASEAELSRTKRDANLQKAAVLAASSLHLSLSAGAYETLFQTLAVLPRPAGKPLAQLDSVEAFSYSPDGRFLATAGSNAARIWNLGTGQPASPVLVPVPAARISTIVFSPDGNYLGAVCRDHSVRLFLKQKGWEADSRLGQGILQLGFSPDSNFVATVGEDNAVRAYRLSGDWAPVSIQHTSSVKAIAFSRGGQWLASGTSSGTVIISETESGKGIASTNFGQGVNFIRFDPNTNFVAVGFSGSEGLCRLWYFSERRVVQAFHGAVLTGLVLSPDGKTLVTAGSRFATVWDAINLSKPITVEHAQLIRAIAFSPGGQLFATASEGGTACLWDTKGTEIARLFHERLVRAIAFNPDGQSVGTLSEEGRMWFWELGGYSSNRMVAVSNIVVAPQFGAQLAFSPNGKRFAAGGRDGTKLWDNETQSLITNLPPFGNAKLVGFSPDGNYLAAADTAGSVVVSTGLLPETARFEPGGEVVALGFSANSRLAVGCLRGIQGAASVFSLPSGQSLCCVPQTNLCALALSPDGSRLATVGPTPRNLRLGEVTPGKEYVILWNVATSNVIRKLPHDFDVTAVAFAPDGKHLATGMTGRTGNTDPINPRVTVWNLDDSTETLLEQERTPWSVAFSSDSQYLAVGGGDYARIWIWREQREIARLNYKHNVREVAFIDRDNSLTMLTQITGSQDAAEQLCCLWRWRPDYLVAQARSRITYRLSTNELRHYLGLAP